MKKIIFISLLFVSYMGLSQSSGVGINTSGVNPDPSAGLDVDFTDKGMLIPRLTTIQRDGIQNPTVALQIYNTTTNCLQIYMPLNGWRNTVCDCQMTPTSSAFTFTDSLSNNSNIVFNAITSGLNYSWTFQSGTPSTSILQTEMVTWANPGVYAVTLTVTDNVGCTSSTTDSITVVTCPPPLAVNFTNCTQTGETGPSQGQCNSAYSGTPLANNVTVTSGIQEWTIPYSGIYEIEAAGARGGGSGGTPGLGAKMKGTFSFNAGETIKILVGQQGLNYVLSECGSGGGGTFVENATTQTLLIVAGGGGASGRSYGSPSNLVNGATSTSGRSGYGSVAGGTNGNGGNAGSSSYAGGGGGGYSGDGGSTGSYGKGGKSYANGGQGGNGSGSSYNGGFGGGGGNGGGGGGGGGGYSGGGGSQVDYEHSGGGGSYVEASAANVSTSDGQYNSSATFNGNAVTNLNSYNSGNGYVNITLVCP